LTAYRRIKMNEIILTAKDIGMITSALETLNPDTAKNERIARALAMLVGSIEASEFYTLRSVKTSKLPRDVCAFARLIQY
jgi:hypothetical protein